MRKFIGVDLGGTNIRAAVVCEDGGILSMKKCESHPERGAEAVGVCASLLAGRCSLASWQNACITFCLIQPMFPA